MENSYEIRIQLTPEEQHLGTVDLPPGMKLVQCKWVFKTKFSADGSPLKYKEILVAKGYS